MAATLSLPFKRFVAQVSIPPRPKVNYLSMMAENLESLKKCDWREAAESVMAEIPPHDFYRDSYVSDGFDAFKMGAQYDTKAMTESAFAGMAAYRFKLPAAYISGSQTLVSMNLPISRDRYLKGGVRVALVLSDDATPSTSWAVVRGESGQAAMLSAQMSQASVEYLTQSAAASDTPIASLTGSDSTKRQYLWVYLTLEDYEDRWTKYNAKEARNYAIEGAAMLSGDLATVRFSGNVAADGGDRVFTVIRGTLTSLPEGSASGARVLQLQRNGDPLVPYELSNSEPTQYTVYIGGEVVATINGTITGYSYTGVTNNKRYVAICGDFDISTFGIRGLSIYEVFSRQRIDGAAVDVNWEVPVALKSKDVKLGIFNDSGVLKIACVYKRAGVSWVKSPQPFLTIDTSQASATASINNFSQITGKYAIFGYATSNPIDESIIYGIRGDVGSDDERLLVYFGDKYVFDLYEYESVERITVAPGESERTGIVFLIGRIYKIKWWQNQGASQVSHDFAGSRFVYMRYVYVPSTQSGVNYVVPDPNVSFHTEYINSLNVIPNEIANANVFGPGVNIPLYSVVGKALGADGGSYPHGFLVTSSGGTRFALPYDAMPLITFDGSIADGNPDSFALVPVSGHEIHAEPTPYYMSNEIANPSATGSAIGLRTLQAKFYLGQTEIVVRASRARLGAAFSVRAGTATLNVATDGVITPTAVPVWRIFSSALVIPFAVPTTWRGKSVRLDWRGWTGTATAGSVFNVWLKAGEYIEDCPSVLGSDVPYDALAAQASGWQLLGTIDATLTGDSRVSTLAAPQLAGKKCATLMLTAFASADGINPDNNTTWPIGAGTEVDCEGTTAEIANTAKAWLPSIYLLS